MIEITFYTTTDGDEVTLTGETLAELHEQLVEYGDEAPGGSITAYDEHGFTAGFVSKASWRFC